jgi:hypothetical protein
MALPALLASGTLSTTVDTTERSITTTTAVGTVRLEVDLNAMAAGDVVELRAKKKLLTGGTQRGYAPGIFYGAQPADDLVARSQDIPNTNTDTASVEFTIIHRFGTSRSLPWCLYQWS